MAHAMPTSKEVIARLEANGWLLVRTRGSHHQFKHRTGRT